MDKLKDNLETFPKPNDKGFYNSTKVTEWKKCFIEELVEMLQSMEPKTPEHILAQEILGEI